jgi:hypothetical protein
VTSALVRAARLLPYLARYGYLFARPSPSPPIAPLPIPRPEEVPEADLWNAVWRFAHFAGLTDSAGNLPDRPDIWDVIEAKASLPRCGMPDFSAAPGAGLCQWPRGHRVKVWQGIELPGVPAATVASCWASALASWEAVCGIEFEPVGSQSQANIWARASRIDGPGSTLAWSYLPCGATAATQVEQRYDTGDSWGSYGATYLQEVMAHELGHALGLNHLPAGNLMQPYATGRLVIPQKGDIAEVLARYGEHAPKPDPPRPDPPKPDPPVPPAPLRIRLPWPGLPGAYIEVGQDPA